jgi:hypothetical protein
MKSRVHNSPNLIYTVGTQVVALKQVRGTNGYDVHPPGAVGVVIRAPQDRKHSYRVRFVDGFEAPLHHDNLMLLAEDKQGDINDSTKALTARGLFDRVIYDARHWDARPWMRPEQTMPQRTRVQSPRTSAINHVGLC